MHIVDGPGEPIFDDCLVFTDVVVPRPVRKRTNDAEPIDPIAAINCVASDAVAYPSRYDSPEMFRWELK